MSYDVSIRPIKGPAKVDRLAVERFLEALPGVRRDQAGIFHYGAPSSRVFMHVYIDSEKDLDGLSLSVAAMSNSKDTVATALLLASHIADHLGWGVYDEQAGQFLDSAERADILKHQSTFGASIPDILKRKASDNFAFSSRFFVHLWHPSSAGILTSIIGAALVTGFLVYRFLLPERVFFWLGVAIALPLLVLSAAVHAVAEKLRNKR